MIGYYARLAWLSVRSTPVLSGLMVVTLGIGIGICMTTISLFYMMSGNPMAHKDDQLFAVQIDSWGPNETYRGIKNHIPEQMTYRDASALLRSDIPTRQIAMFRYGFAVAPEDQNLKPFVTSARVTASDFFAMFDVPFLFGGPWSEAENRTPAYVTVLSKSLNDKLFAGQDSVGQTLQLDGREYRITGVLDDWHLPVKIYDLNNDVVGDPEDLYVPFSLVEPLETKTWGNNNGWDSVEINSFQDYLRSEETWIQYWVELSDEEQKRQYSRFLESYILDQKEQGRFQRPLAYALSKPSEWSVLNNVVKRDNRILVWLSLAFLLVCIVNAVALLLAKFMRKASEAGVRRALGASQKAVFQQHLIESGVVGLMGGILGIGLAQVGLLMLRWIFAGNLDQVAQMDINMVATAILLSLAAALLAGIYPAWRVGQTNPAFYLKTQ